MNFGKHTDFVLNKKNFYEFVKPKPTLKTLYYQTSRDTKAEDGSS